jgi:iron(III) transport system substrate-binding protein
MKKSAVYGALCVAVLALSACAQGTNQSAAVPSSTESSPTTNYEPIVVYSNSVSDGRGDWLVEQAATAGFDIQYVDLGGGDLANRLLAEKSNPIADVVFGLNQVYFENLAAAGVVEAYTPAWADKVDQSSEAGLFWPIVREPIMLVYNTAVYNDSTAPTDWPDLWTKPEFAGKYEVAAGLGGATTQNVLIGILSRYRDDAGELGVSAEGWAAIKAYFAAGNQAVEGQDLYARISTGDVDMGQMWLAGKATREAQYAVQTNAVHPKIGVPMPTQQVAMVNGTKKADTVKAFIDWFGSASVQAAWSQKFFTAPANKDALANASQDAVKVTNSFTEQDIDWAWVASYLPKWIEKVELEDVGQ